MLQIKILLFIKKIKNYFNKKECICNKFIPKKRLEGFVVDIASHCNLNCRGCDHFSPLAKEKFYNLVQFENDFKQLSKITKENIDRIWIMGGEPLLNPDVLKYLEIARKYFPNTKLYLVTNGILLGSQDEYFWKTIKKLNIFVEYTKYPINIDYKKIDELIEKYNISIEEFGSTRYIVKTSYKIPLDLEGKQNSKENFKNCHHANNCITLKNGKIYTCTVAPNIEFFNEYFNYNIPLTKKDGINIYKIKNDKQITRFLAKPIPFCKYCNVKGRTYNNKWGISKRELTEWV